MVIKQKSQKPVKVDTSLKYLCPNIECGCEHWLFLVEAQTKNFKVVCECGAVFRPQRIDNIKIIYSKKNKKTQSKHDTESKETISENLLNRCSQILISYGFEKSEALCLIQATYDKYRTDDVKTLIKQALLEIPTNG
jgi:hypothetical protein